MTTATYYDWMSRPLGKVARIALALAGSTVATLILTTSAMVANASWLFVLLGVAVAALSVRAAVHPSPMRLGLFGAGLVVLPMFGTFI